MTFNWHHDMYTLRLHCLHNIVARSQTIKHPHKSANYVSAKLHLIPRTAAESETSPIGLHSECYTTYDITLVFPFRIR